METLASSQNNYSRNSQHDQRQQPQREFWGSSMYDSSIFRRQCEDEEEEGLVLDDNCYGKLNYDKYARDTTSNSNGRKRPRHEAAMMSRNIPPVHKSEPSAVRPQHHKRHASPPPPPQTPRQHRRDSHNSIAPRFTCGTSCSKGSDHYSAPTVNSSSILRRPAGPINSCSRPCNSSENHQAPPSFLHPSSDPAQRDRMCNTFRSPSQGRPQRRIYGSEDQLYGKKEAGDQPAFRQDYRSCSRSRSTERFPRRFSRSPDSCSRWDDRQSMGRGRSSEDRRSLSPPPVDGRYRNCFSNGDPRCNYRRWIPEDASDYRRDEARAPYARSGRFDKREADVLPTDPYYIPKDRESSLRRGPQHTEFDRKCEKSPPRQDSRNFRRPVDMAPRHIEERRRGGRYGHPPRQFLPGDCRLGVAPCNDGRDTGSRQNDRIPARERVRAWRRPSEHDARVHASREDGMTPRNRVESRDGSHEMILPGTDKRSRSRGHYLPKRSESERFSPQGGNASTMCNNSSTVPQRPPMKSEVHEIYMPCPSLPATGRTLPEQRSPLVASSASSSRSTPPKQFNCVHAPTVISTLETTSCSSTTGERISIPSSDYKRNQGAAPEVADPPKIVGASSAGEAVVGTTKPPVSAKKLEAESEEVATPVSSAMTNDGVATSTLSKPNTDNPAGTVNKPNLANSAPPIKKKTSLGIPMRWLKPTVKPKPKHAKKDPPITKSDSAENRRSTTTTLPKSAVAAPSKKTEGSASAPPSPMANRLVTDSEGGSTVSNNRELLSMMDKKSKPKVPSAIVTTKKHIKGDDDHNMQNFEKKRKSVPTVAELFDEDSDDEPPLESDDDDDDSNAATNTFARAEESSDDSDTDDEEVMQWAAKMFGVSVPSASTHATSMQMEKKEEAPDAPRKPLKLRLKLSPSKILAGASLPPPAPFHEDPFPNTFEEKKREYKKARKAIKAKMRSECQVRESNTSRPIKLKARGRPKKKLKRYLPLEVKEREVDPEQERVEREEEKRIRDEAKPLSAAQIRAILGEDDFQGSSTAWVRRSVRQPSQALLNSKPLQALISGLKTNDPDMVVLKMKKYINDPNAPQCVLDAALEALEENTNCEALYIQNFNEGLRDRQVMHLLRILQSSNCKIWCLNIGENYNVETETWEKFTKGLRRTQVTHMYASEHTITSDMKDEIRETIRENRKKHDMHINPNNLDVIVQCTHCWWNPINAKALRPYLQRRGYEYILNDKEKQGLRGSTSDAPTM